MRSARTATLIAGALAAIVLFVLLRPGGGDDEAAEPAGTPTATAPRLEEPAVTGTETEQEPPETETQEEPETQPAETEPDPDAPVTVRLTFSDGRPEGGIQRPSVRQGRLVRIVVRADVVDHVHLHGYDLMRDVGPGRPAQIQFRAEIPGIFELELEDRRIHIADLEVRP